MSNQLPGSDILGFGFNALGSYSVASVTQQIFGHTTNSARQFVYTPTNTTYDVPDNLAVFEETASGGSCQIFASQEQFQSHFAAKASVKASICGFKGQFSMAYSSNQESRQACSYGLYDMDFTAWRIVLTDQGVTKLADSFANDPDVLRIPDTFNAETAAIFYNILDRYGTHFVSQVIVGGALRYYVAVSDSFSRDERALSANLSLEYNGLFASGKAQSSVAWSQLDQRWAQSRTAHVVAIGGDSSPLNAITPTAGDYKGDLFATWKASVMSNPAILDFQLRPLSILFPGKTGQAMDAAIQAYLNNGIVVESTLDYLPSVPQGTSNYKVFSNIVVGGSLLNPGSFVGTPTPQAGLPAGGIQVALIDSATMTPLLNKLYYTSGAFPPDVFTVYDRIMADVQAISARGYYVAIASYGIPVWGFPKEDFVRWARSCGATLDQWHELISWTGSPFLCGYVLAGQEGLATGQAAEGFASTKTDSLGFEMSEVLLLNHPRRPAVAAMLGKQAR